MDPITHATSIKGPKPLYFDSEMQLMWERADQYGDILRGWKTYCAWGDVPYASGWWLDSDIGMEFLQNVAAISHAVMIRLVITAIERLEGEEWRVPIERGSVTLVEVDHGEPRLVGAEGVGPGHLIGSPRAPVRMGEA